MTLEIENIVASIDLHGPIDMNLVVKNLAPIKYNPRTFPGAAYRMQSPEVTFLIFYSGRLVCTGARDVKTIETAVLYLRHMLESLGMKFEGSPSIKIENIVAAGDIGLGNVELEEIALTLPNVEYEPEIFPGVVYRVRDSSMTILIFNSGKIVVSGAKTEEDIKKAVDRLKNDLERYGLISS
ncbi:MULTISPECIES: TATA-box-binding protein [Thermococcus]|jgi:transcription initiation factor TFIID TATA-box-binding protein|uniref:TATA-box-binding protein n=1 Tax=Thermococcus TaxID=2263 RepID=UPI000C088666|nr:MULTISPECIES: TATA-box-binding protein [Thermococcus]NJE49746.1 TATA-box-binding protein [Thermococcus sp. 9N3]